MAKPVLMKPFPPSSPPVSMRLVKRIVNATDEQHMKIVTEKVRAPGGALYTSPLIEEYTAPINHGMPNPRKTLTLLDPALFLRPLCQLTQQVLCN